MLFSASPENLRTNNLWFGIVLLLSHCFFPSASVPEKEKMMHNVENTKIDIIERNYAKLIDKTKDK